VEDLCCEFFIFNHKALFTLTNSIKTLTSSHYLTRHAKTLKDSEAQARAVLVSRFAESSNQALRNYSAAAKQAPFLATSALKAHKAFTPKVDQDKRLLVVITLKA
jgi:hypothetical protein